MLISTYDPDSQARCPTCEKLVKCQCEGGDLAYYPRYLTLYHDVCGTRWRADVDEKPQYLRDMEDK